MKLTPEELADAKAQLAALNARCVPDWSKLTEADRELLKKYPQHTLEAARMIDTVMAARPPLAGQTIHDAGEDFQFLQWQESGTPYTRQ